MLKSRIPLFSAIAAALTTITASVVHAQDPSALPLTNGGEPPWVSVILAVSWAGFEAYRRYESVQALNAKGLKQQLADLKAKHEAAKEQHEADINTLKDAHSERIDAIKKSHEQALDEARQESAREVKSLRDEIELLREEHFELKLEAKTATFKAEHAGATGTHEQPSNYTDE